MVIYLCVEIALLMMYSSFKKQVHCPLEDWMWSSLESLQELLSEAEIAKSGHRVHQNN